MEKRERSTWQLNLKILLKISKETEDQQLSLLDNEFSSWIKDYEQVDDVCVMGVSHLIFIKLNKVFSRIIYLILGLAFAIIIIIYGIVHISKPSNDGKLVVDEILEKVSIKKDPMGNSI